MTRDEQLIRAALEMAATEAEECGTCAVCGDTFAAAEGIRAIDPADVLAKVDDGNMVPTHMTPDQYRREGFLAGIEAAANARGMWFGFNSSGEPTGEYCTVKEHDPGDMKLYISHDAIRAIDVGEVLATVKKEQTDD